MIFFAYEGLLLVVKEFNNQNCEFFYIDPTHIPFDL